MACTNNNMSAILYYVGLHMLVLGGAILRIPCFYPFGTSIHHSTHNENDFIVVVYILDVCLHYTR